MRDGGSCPDGAENDLRLLDNAVTLAVDEVREDEYERCSSASARSSASTASCIEAGDRAGDADVTVPPPGLPLDSAVDALFDGNGLSAEPGTHQLSA